MCARQNGGAIDLEQGTAKVSDSTFVSNSADTGGAIYVTYFAGTNLIVTRSTFISNTAEHGGAIYVSGGTVSVVDSIFTSNSVSEGNVRSPPHTALSVRDWVVLELNLVLCRGTACAWPW
jgi:predicted outer membrane repeat protein